MSLKDVKADKILVRGVNWLGDAVMTTPAIIRLREAFPNAHIALLTKEHLVDIWREHHCLDQVLTIGGDEGILQLGSRLRGLRFDLGLALPNSFRAALELRLAGIPIRVGYTGTGRFLTLTHAVAHRPNIYRMQKLSPGQINAAISSGNRAQATIPPSAHHVHHYLHLVSELGACADPVAPAIDVSDAEVHDAVSKFGLPADNSRPIVGINAGAEYGPAKRWPAHCFVGAIRELSLRLNPHFVLFGGPADYALAQEITQSLLYAEDSNADRHAVSLHDVAGKTSLRELAALLKNCHLLISNDTGPTHLAAAVGTPVTVPFGSTSPELTGPGNPGRNLDAFIKSDLPCSPCFRRDCPVDFRCMNEITVDQIVDIAEKQLRANERLLFR